MITRLDNDIQNYEVHITIEMPDKACTIFLENWCASSHLKTSKIEGDPLLGNKSFFYVTFHRTKLETALNYMYTLVNSIMGMNYNILRYKVEGIILDVRL